MPSECQTNDIRKQCYKGVYAIISNKENVSEEELGEVLHPLGVSYPDFKSWFKHPMRKLQGSDTFEKWRKHIENVVEADELTDACEAYRSKLAESDTTNNSSSACQNFLKTAAFDDWLNYVKNAPFKPFLDHYCSEYVVAPDPQ